MPLVCVERGRRTEKKWTEYSDRDRPVRGGVEWSGDDGQSRLQSRVNAVGQFGGMQGSREWG